MTFKVKVIYCKRSDTAYLLQDFAYDYALAFGCDDYDKGYSNGLEYALTTLGEGGTVCSIKSFVNDALHSSHIIVDIDVCYDVKEDQNFLVIRSV